MDDTNQMEVSREIPSSTDIALKWLKEYNESSFSGERLKEHFNYWVPNIYCPSVNENCLNWQFNNEVATTTLFRPLEIFICNGDSDEALVQLDHSHQHPSICGQFFKIGEPTYTCRECAMDKTCVFCVDCFKHSSHRFHKYRMGMSGGGGCCDCGDTEAWKKDPFCSIHEVQYSEDDEKDKLPQDLLDRTRIIFSTVLRYCFERISKEEITGMNLAGDQDFFDLDMYSTILYNDEVHTFEQVINTLARVLKCNQRNSTEFVTNIDREGRAVVKCASFQICTDLQHEIEKYTSRHGNKPLKVLVNHSYVIAHQTFAMKLLGWLEKFLTRGKAFRAIFSECMLEDSTQGTLPEPCLLTKVLLSDSSLWKNARTQWHKLLTAGMLLEYENKKALAKLFTKNYPQIIKDFIRDDHEHSFSISSMTVQLYTVPTLAHYLIANDDVLFILLNTVISEYSKKCNEQGKLEFERTPSLHTFKRTLFVFYDLKYLLTFIPETWTDNLRRSFLHGITSLVKLLVMMQGMDSVVRQIGQHMEFEPEWESGFNLHIKVATCISLFIEWCGTDKVVLVKAYKCVLTALLEHPCYNTSESLETREIADHGTSCLRYDVSTKPVSVHLPLTRLLAALHLHLEKFNLNFDSPELQISKPTPAQIIEPVLRTQVMIAQVHSGMWRRNGYALLNTLYFYHNVKCRTEMLDRDIIMLQIGASLIESNEFLIHLLNKFNLMNWSVHDFETATLKASEEENMRQTICLVEELLHLLIIIIGERHVPGVSNVTVKERIKQDILHVLCIKQAAHSELVKTVSDDLENEQDLVDDVIHEVAKFNEPPKSSNSKGKYELLPQFYDKFNVFFYHYTREEMSRAEVNQRKRHKDKGELECCPPPKLPPLCESFTLVVNLLQCDVMLHLIRTIFERCLNLRARSFSENQLHKVLYLIGYGLQEEESGLYPFFKFIEKATKFKIFELMEALVKCPRVDAHKELLKWTLKKYYEMTKKSESNFLAKEEASTSSEDDEARKKRRAKLAADKRAKVMAQMTAQQNNFIKENSEYFEQPSVPMGGTTTESCEMEVTEYQPIALGPNQSARVPSEQLYTCILCQESEQPSSSVRIMVMAAFVQPATVLCHDRSVDQMTIINDQNPLFLSTNRGPAAYTSTCGHVMHSSCWRKFFDNVMLKEHRRPYRLRHPSSFDVDKQEFLCPLCECLSNTVLPLLPSVNKAEYLTSDTERKRIRNNIPFESFLFDLNKVVETKNKKCHGIFKCNSENCPNMHCIACVKVANGTNAEVDNFACEVNCALQSHQVYFSNSLDKCDSQLSQEFRDLFATSIVNIFPSFKDVLRMFAQVTYTKGLAVSPHPSDKRLVPMAWKSLAYTIEAIEVITRFQNKPLLGSLTSRHKDCIENLVKTVTLLGNSWTQNLIMKNYAFNLISILLEHPESGPSILDFNPFSFLLSVTYSLPTLLLKFSNPIPLGGTLEWHTLRLMLIVNMVVNLLYFTPRSADVFDSDVSQYSIVQHASLIEFLKKVHKWDVNMCPNKVWNHLKESSRPFLRCCVLFYHCLTEIPASTPLQEQNGDTFENMCAYLDLPINSEELLGGAFIKQLIYKWLNHSDITGVLESSLPIVKPVLIPQLVQLPTDYSELLNSVSSYSCPNNQEDSRNPTLCLVCGMIVCSQSYCCQTEYNKLPVGACNFHASICGAGVGLFLRIRDCELLLLATPHRGCFLSPPYLDEHGETDQGLRRGNPLKLNPERYEKLHLMWLNHNIHEEIARQIETTNHIIPTPWNML